MAKKEQPDFDSLCVDDVVKAFPGMDTEDLTAIEREIKKIDKVYADKPAQLVMKKKELYDAVESAQLQRVLQEKVDQIKFEVNMDRIKMAEFEGQMDEGLLALIERSEVSSKGSQASVERMGKVYSEEILSNLIDDVNEQDLFEVLKSRTYDREIFNRLRDLEKPDAKPSDIPAVEALAKIFKHTNDKIYNLARRAGIKTRYLSDWGTRQLWDPSKMMGNKEQWIKSMFENLDFERSGLSGLEGKALFEELGKRYDNIVNSALGVPGKSGKKGNIIKQLEAGRTLHFKNGDVAFDAMHEWGYGGMFETYVMNIDRVAKRSALVEKFGSDPIRGFERLAAEVERLHADNPAIRQGVKEARKSFRMVAFGVNDGYTTPAYVAKIIKDFTAITSLGRAINVAMFGDLASTAINLRGAGGQNLLGATLESLYTFFDAMGVKDKDIIKEFKMAFDMEIMDQIQRYIGEDNDGFKRTKWKQFKTYAYKAFLLPQQFKVSRKTNAILWGRLLKKNLSSSFDELSKNLKASLIENNIDATKWDIIRGSKANNLGITVNTVDMLPVEVFKNPHNVEPALYKAEILRDLTSFFHSQVDRGTPIPLTKELRRLGADIDPDSYPGLIAGFMRQFKTIPLKISTDTMGHVRRESGQSTLRKAFDPRISLNGYKMFGLAATQFTMLAYASMTLKALIDGEEPPDPSDPKTWEEAFTRGGVTGMWGDLVLGEYEKIYRSPVKDLAGPAAARFDEALTILARLRAGEDVSDQKIQFLWRNIPGNNLWFLNTTMKKNILESIKDAVQ